MNYAQIENGIVTNLFIFDDETSPLIEEMGVTEAEEGVCIGWKYENGQFIEPKPVIEELTPEQIQLGHEAEKARLLALASEKIAVLQDAVDLEMATDEEIRQLKVWKTFRVLVNRTDTGKTDVQFPELPND